MPLKFVPPEKAAKRKSAFAEKVACIKSATFLKVDSINNALLPENLVKRKSASSEKIALRKSASSENLDHVKSAFPENSVLRKLAAVNL